jgi:alcohol dehydrogenase
MPVREKVWKRLASDLKPKRLDRIATTVNFDDLPRVFEKVMKREIRGRTVVKIG